MDNVERVNKRSQTEAVQHMGFGKKLLKEAEKIFKIMDMINSNYISSRNYVIIIENLIMT